MRLIRLLLSDYRNFHRLDLRLPAGLSLFLGDNAQGKSNLLEAIHLLATMRSPRAQSEAQLIRWQAQDEPLPSARIVGEAESRGGPLKVEVTVVGREGNGGLLASRGVRVNGLPKRLSEAVGQLTAVLFTADDLHLVKGPPSLRRRYLDITIAQVDAAYLGARQRYEKVLLQRNHLLRRIRERLARPQELAFWNQELVREGAYIFSARARALAAIGALAATIHAELAPGQELRLLYQPCLSGRQARLPVRQTGLPLEGEAKLSPEAEPEEIAALFADAQRRYLERETAAGMTLLGPHRDDLSFFLDGMASADFASRAQQRTIALALRLAEARYLWAQRGEPPILLLDDVLSEMDAQHRRCVLAAIAQYEQVLITATDLAPFPADLLAPAALYQVAEGTVSPADAVSARRGQTPVGDA